MYDNLGERAAGSEEDKAKQMLAFLGKLEQQLSSFLRRNVIFLIIAISLSITFSAVNSDATGPLSSSKVGDNTEYIQMSTIGPPSGHNVSGSKNGANENEPLINESIQGVIVGGIIGFVSAIVTDIIKRWLTRPKISISEQAIEEDVILYKRKFPNEKWVITRVKVENKGKSAAENCKASLKIDDSEYRIAWRNFRDDGTVTINAHDIEYIDLCAIRQDPLNPNGYERRFTSERGYGEAAADAPILSEETISGELKASAKNAKPSIKNIKIHKSPYDGKKIVQFV